MADIGSDSPGADFHGAADALDAGGSAGSPGGDDTQETRAFPATAPVSSGKKLLKQLIWIGFAVFCIVFFTIMKLPEERIRAYVQGSINSALVSQGMSISAAQSYVSVGLGVTYTMKDVTITFPPPSDPAKVEQISVSPSILSLLLGKIGGKAWINQKNGGSLIANFSLPANPKPGSNPLDLTANLNQFDVGAIGALKLAANLKGTALISGDVVISGDMASPSSMDGHTTLEFSKIVIDSQSVMGFNIPRLSISEGKADILIDKGKAQFKTLQIGKSANDDIRAAITGDLTLAKTWPQSTLNAKANFSLSDNVIQAFPLIDTLLTAAKQPDKSYAYVLNGPLATLTPVPGK